jgi:hypothetical protein
MKRTFVVLVVIAIACVSAGAAPKQQVNAIRPGLFELGLYIGEPTGLSAKYWINRNNAVEGVAAWAFSQGGFLVVAADYLFNFPDIVKIEEETFPLYVGAGAIMRVDMGTGGGISVGARFPLGALYVFRGVPLEISLEIVPGLYIFPATQFLAMAGIGIRYCF